MIDDEESGLPGAGDSLGFGPEESEPTVGDEGKGHGVDEADALVVDMGAAVDADEDATKEAAKTSFDMEGFETGAGFDLEDVPDGGDQHLEMEDLVVDRDFGGSLDVHRTVSDRAVSSHVDLRIADHDEASLLLPTPTDDDARPKARHRGLEALERRRKRSKRARRLMTVSAVLVVGGGGFAAFYWGVVEIPGITLSEWSRFAVRAPAAPSGPQPETPVMSHVILVDTWREAETPRAWADALRERMPELLGFVTPLSIDGDRQYVLLVGPAYSAAEAEELRAPLGIAFDLLNPDPESWAVQEAPYSFLLGEYETLGEANGRVQALAELSIPAFVLRVTYPSQAGALRVYAGAFSDEVQARAMRRLLGENDLGDASFTELRGRLPG